MFVDVILTLLFLVGLLGFTVTVCAALLDQFDSQAYRPLFRHVFRRRD